MALILAFLPSLRAITDTKSNSLSIIEVLDKLAINPVLIPEENGSFVLPITWTFTTIWNIEDDECGQNFAQRIELRAPNTEIIGRAESPFQRESSRHQRTITVVVEIFGFPVVGDGEYYANLSVKRQEGNWDNVSSFPIIVKFEELNGEELISNS
ncbi:MAG: hypothetical protein EOO20_26635 [Chryseobacterium sp.]|nr:MAG: hypothetical protein EOO20_26635 [Chryseobacterium sp.]